MPVFEADLMFVCGLVVLVFAFPPIVGALSDGRAPRAAAIMVLIGGGLVAITVMQYPSRYTLATIPDTFVRVIGHYIN